MTEWRLVQVRLTDEELQALERIAELADSTPGKVLRVMLLREFEVAALAALKAGGNGWMA